MSANEKQVGGDHYRTHGQKLQHWDLAVMYQWDPFQYQVTKYLMRWKYKHSTPAKRLEDLKKAAHFLQKYIEVAEEYDTLAAIESKELGTVPVPIRPQAAEILSNEDWQCEGYYGDLTQHYRCKHCGTMVRAATLEDAHQAHGACPTGQGYVNQGD